MAELVHVLLSLIAPAAKPAVLHEQETPALTSRDEGAHTHTVAATLRPDITVPAGHVSASSPAPQAETKAKDVAFVVSVPFSGAVRQAVVELPPSVVQRARRVLAALLVVLGMGLLAFLMRSFSVVVRSILRVAAKVIGSWIVKAVVFLVVALGPWTGVADIARGAFGVFTATLAASIHTA